MIKIFVFAICGVLLSLVLKRERMEFSMLLGIAVGAILFGFAMEQIIEVFSFLQEQMLSVSIDQSNLVTMIKILGISYVTEFMSSICRDFGYSSIASVVELIAKLSILILCFSGFGYILEVIGGIL